MDPHNPKDHAIKSAILNQCAALLDDHFEAVVSAAHETFKQDDNASEIEAKMAFAVSFFPAVAAPIVKVKASWSVRYSDEQESVVDPDQQKMPFVVGNDDPKDAA